MPSPFPGMNPYIERASVWHDFHESFMPLVAELTLRVLPRYFVRIDEQMYIHELVRRRNAVFGQRRYSGICTLRQPTSAVAAMQCWTPQPKFDEPAVDSEAHSFLEIRDRDDHELVTVVELLSPCNKYMGPDREQYLAKARQLQRSRAHFVEIDLLRGGPRMPWLDMPECDYCVVVSRVERRPKAGFWPIRLHERLPEIPIPLRHGDADARVDLQQVLNRIYDAAGYAYHIYSGPPEPLLLDGRRSLGGYVGRCRAG